MNIKEQLSTGKLELPAVGEAVRAFFGSSKGCSDIMSKINKDIRALDELFYGLLFCKTDNDGNATRKGNIR